MTAEIIDEVCPDCETNPSVTCYESEVLPNGTKICGNCGEEY